MRHRLVANCRHRVALCYRSKASHLPWTIILGSEVLPQAKKSFAAERGISEFGSVKSCSYCGRQNEAGALACYECGTPFPAATTEQLSPKHPPQPDLETQNAPGFKVVSLTEPEIPELCHLDLGSQVVEGFSRPNWKLIGEFINERIKPDDFPSAWDFAARKWLEQLANELGGGACLCSSTNFLCVSDLQEAITRTLLTYAESVLGIIRSTLQSAARGGYPGRHVLLVFSDQDDYYAYVSYYSRDGLNPLTGGVSLERDYVHIAMPFGGLRRAEHTVVHELIHDLLAHLHLPLWLNEGLAVVIERTIQRRTFLLDKDLVDRHAKHWTDKTIQTFWAGTSWYIPGESNTLSYSLAEILLTLLAEEGHSLIEFIKHADWHDAGQDAALNFLGKDLGDLAGEFLGPGDWRPQRKAIAALLNARWGRSK